MVPTYISEISPAEIRGTLLVFEQLSIVVGVIVAFWITYGTRFIDSAWSWRLPFLLQLLPGLVLGVGAVFLPFSPRWLANQGRDDLALHTLARLRQLPVTDRRVEKEWLDILAESRYQQQQFVEMHEDLVPGDRIRSELASWADCFRGRSWRRTMVGSGITTFQQVGFFPWFFSFFFFFPPKTKATTRSERLTWTTSLSASMPSSTTPQRCSSKYSHQDL